MDASLIVALGAFLLSSISLLVSMNNRGQDIQVQMEQKKQEALVVLHEIYLASLLHQGSLRQVRQLAAGLSPADELEIDNTIRLYEQNIPEVTDTIERLSVIVSNQDQATLVQVSGLLGESILLRQSSDAVWSQAKRFVELLGNNPKSPID